jgi:selenocysteine lyase/cysteine desulfurase
MEEARGLFPLLRERAYLIAGAVAPANTRSLEMMRTYLEIAARDPMGAYPGVPGAVVAIEEVRELFAGLMHADASSLIFSGRQRAEMSFSTSSRTLRASTLG